MTDKDGGTFLAVFVVISCACVSCCISFWVRANRHRIGADASTKPYGGSQQHVARSTFEIEGEVPCPRTESSKYQAGLVGNPLASSSEEDDDEDDLNLAARVTGGFVTQDFCTEFMEEREAYQSEIASCCKSIRLVQ